LDRLAPFDDEFLLVVIETPDSFRRHARTTAIRWTFLC